VKIEFEPSTPATEATLTRRVPAKQMVRDVRHAVRKLQTAREKLWIAFEGQRERDIVARIEPPYYLMM
jgi:hypothetical protein